MNILVIGSGGREHALAWKLAGSKDAGEVFVAPGNGGTAKDFTNVDIGVMDFDGLVNFSKENDIGLVVVGPEDPLDAGIVDRFTQEGIKIFGPNQACAEFESSKDFTKKFLNKHSVPTAESFTTSDYDEAMKNLSRFDYPLVIKADGLFQGKGVVIAEDYQVAQKTLEDMLQKDIYGESGGRVVIEEFLKGDEQSLLCFVSNNKIIPMDTARDYKKAYDGDLGLNTGGVGVYSPSKQASEKLSKNMEEVLKKIEDGLNEDGYDFNGILFIGFMIEDDIPKVLEFNVRFGDPETEVLMPRLESDLLEVILKALDGSLEKEDLKWSNKACVGVVLYSDGYPGAYDKNYLITGLDKDLDENQIIFHNGTKLVNDEFFTNGGRVLTCVAMADTIEEARKGAYDLVDDIQCLSLKYRRDIGEI